ncbi:MAG TPA: 2-dehydropantoate 2-reductase [Anaerolineales bacterium]|nr:2-dehydropantoate 2-reductase [Anaerolineales bacterium]
MRIAVLGAGGVGGYFGGILAHSGYEVVFIARGENLEALRRDGLVVRSVHGDFAVRPVVATDHPDEVEPVDYVIVAVKHFQLADAAPAIEPLVGPDCVVVPLLNGVDAHEILAAHVGAERVVGGLCSVVSMVERPGVIRQESRMRRVAIGELDRRKSERVQRLVQAWATAGVDATQAEDIHVALWSKFVFIAAFGGVSSLARANAGEIRSRPETRALLSAAIGEVEQVGRAKAVALAPAILEDTMKVIDGLEPTATSSMQRDVAAGKAFELDAFSGALVRLGRELGVPTPVHTVIDALLRPALHRSVS